MTLDLILIAIAVLVVAALAVDFLRPRRAPEELNPLLATRGLPPVEETAEPEPGRFGRNLRSAGIGENVAEFVLILVLLGAMVFLATALVLPLAIGLVAGLVAIWAVYTLVDQYGLWRARRFEEELADGIDLLIASLEGGENLPRALMSAATACPHRRVKLEFTEIADRLAVGATMERAVARLARRYDSEGTRLFVQTLLTKWRAGGEMGPVLRSVNRIIRERIKLRMHLRAQLAGARIAAILAALIPYLLIPFYLARRPEWFDILLHHHLGPWVLAGALLLQIVGILWLRRILRLEV